MTKAEQDALIAEALETDPALRAFVIVVALLKKLPDDDARHRVMRSVAIVLRCER